LNRFILLLLLLLFSSHILFAQDEFQSKQFANFFAVELLGGNTIPPTAYSSKTKNEKGFMLHFGTNNSNNNEEWAYRLNYPRTGFSIGVNDFGNSDEIGYSVSFIPFLEFNVLKNKNLYLNTGLGTSVFTKKYNSINNANNKSITTNINWAFRLFFHYRIFHSKKIEWRLGFGYFHQSNGHVRLPNEGLNSLFASTTFQLNYKAETQLKVEEDFVTDVREKSQNTYISVRTGLGANVLSKNINTPRPVYTLAVSMGKTYNKTFKYGGGIYYRFYKQYYDHIVSEGELINEEYPHFKEKPYQCASNINVFGSLEVLLGHIALELELGYNIYKPFYVIDRKVGQAYTYYVRGEEFYALGDLDFTYKLKQNISSRLGLKYYFLTNENKNPYNFFLSANINANFGQADFNEISLGMVYNFNFYKE